MDKDRYDQIKNVLAVIAVLILTAVVGQAVSVISFNQRDHHAEGADDTKASYLVINDREDSTSRWVKRDYDLDGETVDINAQTFDATLFNKAAYDITDWKLTIKISGDCFINNAWCGTVEIHQHAGKNNEKVKTLDLRNYKLEDVKLDHYYDGDLLIPLSEGDYIVYEPSAKDDEVPIRADSELTMGMIMYYVDSIDLSDYRLDYHYHRAFTEGAGFIAIMILLALWMAVFIFYIAADVTYKRAWKDMELKRSGLSYMSAIYDLICIVNIGRDRLTVLYSDEEYEDIVNSRDSAREQLLEQFRQDASEQYLEATQLFADISTLDERMTGGSLTCEYKSDKYGWRRARFIAIDRTEGEPLEEVIFTIHGINEEKRDVEQLEERLKQKIQYRKLSLEESGYSFRTLISEICEYSEKIAEKEGREFVKDISRDLPDMVVGNESLLRHVISYLLKYASECGGKSPVKLSVYSKTQEDSAHILVSVTGRIDPSMVDDAAHELVDGLLGLTGSSLKTIDGDDGMHEMYFETDQLLAGDDASK